MRTPILGLAIAQSLAFWSGAALAQTAPAPASAAQPVATGSPSAADQIDAFIKATPVPDVTQDPAPGVTSSAEPPDRRIHGVVEVGVGSNGYRHAYGRADMPLGDSGQLSIAVGEDRFKGRFGRWGAAGSSLSLGAGFGSALAGECRPRVSDGELATAPYVSTLDVPRLGGACRTLQRAAP